MESLWTNGHLSVRVTLQPASGRRARERRTSVFRPPHRTALRPAVGTLPAAFGPALAALGRRHRGAGAAPALVEVGATRRDPHRRRGGRRGAGPRLHPVRRRLDQHREQGRGVPPGRGQDRPRPVHEVQRDRELRPARLRVPPPPPNRRTRYAVSTAAPPASTAVPRTSPPATSSSRSRPSRRPRRRTRRSRPSPASSPPESPPTCARSPPYSCAWTPVSPTTATATAPPPATRPSSRPAPPSSSTTTACPASAAPAATR